MWDLLYHKSPNLINQSIFTKAILTAISKDELKNIKLPLLPESIQSTISLKLQQSFLDRQKSVELLNVAKRAVEVAIEDGEDAALEYVRSCGE